MSEDPIIHDLSRVDAYAQSRRRISLLEASWRPALAGAVASLAVSAAIWVVLPKISVHDYEVPRISYVPTEVPRITERNVSVDHIVPHDLPIPIPRIVEASPLARTPAERSFTGTEDWRASDIRGRILRADRNGFDIATEDRGEVFFSPAKLDASGKAVPNPAVRDEVTGLIGALARCSPLPIGTYACVALRRDGTEIAIAQTPVGAPL
jgi:hypothetical protein